MPFDPAQFRKELQGAFALAAAPTWWPTPDSTIADETERRRLHEAAVARAMAARWAAIRDVAKHHGARLVGIRIGQQWPAPVADDAINPEQLIELARAAIDEGAGESLTDAAALLAIAAFFKFVQE